MRCLTKSQIRIQNTTTGCVWNTVFKRIMNKQLIPEKNHITQATHYYRKVKTYVGLLLVEVINTMDLVWSINCEGNTIKGLVALNTGETLRMVGLACGTQDAVQDGFCTHTTFFQSVLQNYILFINCWLNIKVTDKSDFSER